MLRWIPRLMLRLTASFALLLGACGAGSEGHGAEWQFVSERSEVVESTGTEQGHPEWVHCVRNTDCVVVPASCCCDGRTWTAVRFSFADALRASVCEGAPTCNPTCDEPPPALCEDSRCRVSGT